MKKIDLQIRKTTVVKLTKCSKDSSKSYSTVTWPG